MLVTLTGYKEDLWKYADFDIVALVNTSTCGRFDVLHECIMEVVLLRKQQCHFRGLNCVWRVGN